ncbi:olfactory receptor Olr636 [Rattus norvegicus]|uniref:Olfactory receptor n=1 Tax=Rattus norvegicus TaxID=10116 RepID=A0A0G2K4B1_RAT|nr:olfactory receptor Olr636 [Rattus norvegicus]|eukprot:NP_001000645.1 olfactory receptor Olr636 [Rattus norvegicus]
MECKRNISEFLLIGLSSKQNIEVFCFLFFSFCYLAILSGNLMILISVRCSSLFNQPMYYFLSHLSSMDICYTSCVTPKLIGDLLVRRKYISYTICMLQVIAMHFFGVIEVLILAAMAFDRCVAICKPLHCMLIMSRSKCHVLILVSWVGGAAHSFSQFCLLICLPFCGPNEIDHYYCDIFPLLKVACTDTTIAGMLVVANSGLIALVTFVLLFGSYVVILFTLRNYSAEQRHKALSTCGSHITVVILFFGPSIFAYLRPPTTFPEDKIFALFYTIIAPMFNPLIYTLRNTEMKKAIKKVWCQKRFFRRETVNF